VYLLKVVLQRGRVFLMVHWYDYILHIGSPLVKSSIRLILLLPPMFSSLCMRVGLVMYSVKQFGPVSMCIKVKSTELEHFWVRLWNSSETNLFFCVQDLMARRPVDPEEELRWMSQEVRGYVEAVLNSLAANVPKVSLSSFFFCFYFLLIAAHLWEAFIMLRNWSIRQLFFAKLRKRRKICWISCIALSGMVQYLFLYLITFVHCFTRKLIHSYLLDQFMWLLLVSCYGSHGCLFYRNFPVTET
jgi:hypothetical protein